MNLLINLTYVTLTLQICLICCIIENKIKVFLEELKDILNTCVINNNDIFLVSDSLEGLSNNYNQNILLRRTILKDSIAKYLKLIAFTEAFNKEYQEELFLLYIFYLNCAEQFLSSIFHLNSKYPLVIFHVVKLINVILQFIYLSYCCYMVKKQNSELELMLINYNNLCEQDMFNLINLLLHKLNINGMDFSALDFVYIDMEMFIKTTRLRMRWLRKEVRGGGREVCGGEGGGRRGEGEDKDEIEEKKEEEDNFAEEEEK
ncbi:hypothetical protein WDU94_013500 [Cyamophila willieti]